MRLLGLSCLFVAACGDPFGWKQQTCDEAKERARATWETAAQSLPAEIEAQRLRLGEALRKESEVRIALPEAGSGQAAAAAKVASARTALRRRARGTDYDDATRVAEKMARGEPAYTYNYLSKQAFALANALRDQQKLEKQKEAARKAMDLAEEQRRVAQARLSLLRALVYRIEQARERATGRGRSPMEATDAVFDLRRQLGWDQKPPASLAAADAASWEAQADCEGVNEGDAEPLPLVPAESYSDVSAGFEHTCVVMPDGWLGCWGDNRYGQSSAPYGAFRQVAAGARHTSARAADGTVRTWGDDAPVTPPGSFSSLSAGDGFTCGLRDDARMVCWGTLSGVLEGTYTQIDAGRAHACALAQDGSAACLGEGPVPPPGPYAELSAGDGFTCAVRTDGTLGCWGRSPPGAPEGRLHGLSSGGGFVCALDEADAPRCWGDVRHGEGRVPAGRYTRLAAGPDHVCAIATDASLACWGRNQAGQAGDHWTAGG